ncbi:carboxymuconolactone decarboxylase family protein [Solimonas sp. K1W22B-7]|uniref:carboxymuconolactone decarboxylase family protein n=1 Tax=Solimonas sp. K1W22B-7 TaxID=2303331 RepID=UPI000E335599|nr:carboxymuconolactone decarboxylase family protein [Solimonas sp. K1W22B-7]AXQ28871.1 carboxymuconolactone decarboxylase family protein [Solimonas sp. K1W22B-7]
MSAPVPPRIEALPLPLAPELESALKELMRGAPPLLIFRTVAHNPRVLARMLAGGLLDRGSIPLRLRELIILRTTALCGAEYEWGVHAAIYGGKAQLGREELQASVHGAADAPAWNREERLVLQLADALHHRCDVDEVLWAELRSAFAEDQLIELTMLAGLYHAVSFLVNVTRVPHEAFAPGFPAT